MKMDTAKLVVFGHFISVLIFGFGLKCVTSSSGDLALRKDATQSSTYSPYDASRAVDGIPGRDVPGGYCSHTGTGHNQVWWKVDLGEMCRIQTIKITYRHGYTYRLSGYYLYVTNDTHMTQSNGGINASLGYLCYHDNGRGYLSYNQSRTCPVTGRYVIIYNKRPADNVPPDPDAHYSTTEALIELCEVEVFGCPVGQFGDGCSFTCHCAEMGCDPETGQCDMEGCQTEWKGPSCYAASRDLAYRRMAIQSSVNIHSTFDANKAVDGYPGENSCSHTYPDAWPEAWWMVDLGQAHRINTINIVFAHKHQFIISGYFLYVTKDPIRLYHTTSLRVGQLCYHDTTTTSDGPPPYRQSHQCFVTGRYVIVYNNRSSSLAKSPSHYSPEDAVVELCDVQVFSCSITTFGPNCSHVCHCMSDGCDPVSGVCHVPECQHGWTGDSCSTHECSSGNFGPGCSKVCHCQQDGCDHTNGRCDYVGCEAGWRGQACDQQCVNHTFGRDCSQTCHCADSGCDRMNGTCAKPGCMEGWTGDTCSQECSSGKFGPQCSKMCHCRQEGCDHVHGKCHHAGCQAGWSGQACDQQCVNSTFGRDCNQTCHCARSDCDRTNGACNLPRCTKGWSGNTCSQECGSHTFERACNQTCHCANSSCDSVSGVCTIPGCTEGWNGDTCSQECSSGYFGLKCSKVCHCQHEGCDHVNGTCNLNGCQAGWSGRACDHQCSSNTFGRDCNQTCHCASSGCDRMNGTCAIPGCTKGWTGHSCSHECVNNTFGRDCNQTCHCVISGCDRVTGMCNATGCTKGWSGDSCSEAQKHISSQLDCPYVAELTSSVDSSRTTGYALLGTFLAISVSLNIGLIIYFVRVRFRNTRTETPSNELQTYYIPNYENSYEGLDSSKSDTTRNIYDTIVK